MRELEDWNEGVAGIDWSQFRTAYGVATDVPAQLQRLRSSDLNEALAASHDLWCGLCHQHVRIASAALPVFPFLLAVFETADEKLKIELLDIFLGFAKGSNPSRLEEYAQAIGRGQRPQDPWIAQVRALLVAQAPRFISLRNDPNPDIADFARSILEEIRDADPSISTQLAAAEPPIPDFNTKSEEFIRFVVSQGWPPTLRWAKPEDVILRKWRGQVTQFVWAGNAQQRELEARAEYQKASSNQIGLVFEANGKTDRRTVCRIYVPSDPLDAAYRMIPRIGVKFSVSCRPLPVVLVENAWLWSILRWTRGSGYSIWD